MWQSNRFCLRFHIGGADMQRLKPFIVLAAILFTITLVLPALLVLPFAEKASGEPEEELQAAPKPTSYSLEEPAVEVSVYRVAKETKEDVPLEEYLVGVVASEMNADFELEALKAQALAARTYIVKQMLSEEKLGVPAGSDVTDTVNHQVYKSDQELKQQWGIEYKWRVEKIRRAVEETSGQILTYEGIPINATFFSTSNGLTENAEEIWPNELPYLVSVESPWDTKSPKFKAQKVFAVSQFEQKLGVKVPDGKTIGKVTKRTAGNRVGKVEINGKTLTGREVREKLGLNSTDFNWERKGEQIIVNTQGYGHGVGMSQYGANGMATEGKTYDQIAAHYYKGAEISSADEYLNRIMAKK